MAYTDEIAKASQAAYNAWIQGQRDAGVTCDADLSPKEKKERKEFDKNRTDTYTGTWPARQK